MRILGQLYNKVGKLTKLYSNLPESYIKRSMEQVYYRSPRGYPNYQKKDIKRKKYHFGTTRPWTSEFLQDNQSGTLKRKVFLEPVGEWTIFKGDRVEILVGKDKGKQGIVCQVFQERNWVIVEGLNTKLKLVSKEKNFPGIYVREELPLLVTDEVKLIDPETLKPTEVEWRYTESGDKVRVSAASSRIIPMPVQAYETKDYKSKNTYPESSTKDTTADVLEEITFKPTLKTFEMEIMDEMGIKEDRIPVKSFWY